MALNQPSDRVLTFALGLPVERVDENLGTSESRFSQHAPEVRVRSQVFLPAQQKIFLIVLPQRKNKMSLNDAEVQKQVSVQFIYYLSLNSVTL